MSEPEPVPAAPRHHPLALAAFALGACSLLLQVVTGVPALICGYRSLYAINAANGAWRGRGLAIWGMLLGSVGILVSVGWLIFTILSGMQDSSRRAQCADNLRVVGMAVALYADEHGNFFPPGTRPNSSLPPEQRLSWQTSLLPYLERRKDGSARWQDTWGALDRDAAWDAPTNQAAVNREIVRYLCPADPRAVERQPTNHTSYPGLAGVGLDAALEPKENPNAGFFGYTRLITPDDLKAGLAQTVIVAETAHATGPWAAGGPPTVRGLDPECDEYFGPGRPIGGLHPDGQYFLFADGSARFQSERLAPNLFRHLTRINRENSGE